MPTSLNIGVLGSGSGSNMQSIIDAIEAGALNAKIRLVLSDAADAHILERARLHNLACEWLDCAPYKTKLDGTAETRCIERLQAHGVDTIVLAGFMRIVKSGLLCAFPNRVLNIHPALLPAFPGVAGWQQALAYGVKVAGCTVHFVDAGTDTGPIIIQRCVAVHEDDTAASLHTRIQVEEHKAYPEALRLLSEGRLTIVGRRVNIKR